MDVKNRQVRPRTYTSSSYIWSDEPSTFNKYSAFLTGHQRTESEGHPVSRIGKSNEDVGGPFSTQVWRPPKPSGIYDLADRGGMWGFHGPLWPFPPLEIFQKREMLERDWQLNNVQSPIDLLVSRGTDFIAATTPTNSAFSAAAALGELREGLPSIPGKTVLKKGGAPSGFADEFLNLEFGALPMISDAKRFLKARRDSDEILEQLYRDSGRLVRRRRSLPPEVKEWEDPVTRAQPWAPGGLNSYNSDAGTRIRHYKQTRKYWFAGGYTYLFPRQDGWHQKVVELDKVYGIIPDVNDLWQLTPWSWAVDWVSNLGSLIQNMNSFAHDSLVLRFGYVMCQTDLEVTDTWKGMLSYPGLGWMETELTSSYSCTSKQRVKATPYGFGLDTGTFTNQQWAIISALGISRSGKR